MKLEDALLAEPEAASSEVEYVSGMLDDCELVDLRLNAREGTAALLCTGSAWYPHSNTVLIVARGVRSLKGAFSPQTSAHLARAVLGSQLTRRDGFDQMSLGLWEPEGSSS